MMTRFSGLVWLLVASWLGFACGHGDADFQGAATVDTSARYALISVSSSHCLRPEGEGVEVGTRVKIAECEDSEFQEYVFDPATAGTYTVQNVGAGLCLEASGGLGSTGEIIQSTCSGAAEQRFALRGAGGGKFKVVCPSHATVWSASGTAVGSGVAQEASSARSNQEFVLRRVGDRAERRPDGGPAELGDGGGGVGPDRADAGRADAGRVDAGRPDAGRPDVGGFDAGMRTDAGRPDGGGRDAGNPGNDAGIPGPPPTKTVRVFYLYPSDVRLDQRYPDGIGKVMLDAQAFFKKSLGKTFVLNNPIVEVVKGDHTRSWYENTANGGDKYWWSVFNASQELQRRFGLRSGDPRWVIVSEVSAEGDGAGGGGGDGWVLMPGHDADGAAGYPANTSRWVGGMVHELGHAFMLPDSTSTDGTCMSASFYGWPNCTFTQSQKDGMLRGKYGSFLQ